MERPQQNLTELSSLTELSNVTETSHLIELPNGMHVYEHGDTSYIVNEIWHAKSYQNLRDVKAGDVVFDIGANQGIFSLYAASKGARVFSVEPDPANFAVLQKNIALNKLENVVTAIHCAVASQEGFLTLYIPERDGKPLTGLITTTKSVSEQYSGMNITAMREYNVKAVPLPQIFKEYKIQCVDLLKIDCEGAELDILSGGDKDDFKIVKHLVMETHAGYSEAALYKKVQQLGFQVVSYQQISGVYLTGYMWAESLQIAEEIPYAKPVAIAQLSDARTLGETIVVDVSKSFSTDLNIDALIYDCTLNGKKMQRFGPYSFTAIIDQKNLNQIKLTVSQSGQSSCYELNFWAFEKNYFQSLPENTTQLALKLATDKVIRLKGIQHFVMPESEMPKSWEGRYFYLCIKIENWYLQGQPTIHVLFNGDDYCVSEDQKTFEFPFFYSDAGFCFSLQNEQEREQEVEITLRCYVLETPTNKPQDDINLGEAEYFKLPQQGQKYLCRSNLKSTFEFEFNYDPWVPNCIKFGLGLSADSAPDGELTGQIKIGEDTQSLNGWYREFKFLPPFENSKIKLELSTPIPRNYAVAWWPE